MLVWAFQDEHVETAHAPHPDAAALYCNVMALPIAEASTLISHARRGNVQPSDPIALAHWTRGLNLLREMLAQPMCSLSLLEEPGEKPAGRTRAA
ncbi:hypothetical protein GCM10011499_33820 [Pelagibacterium lentulum]|uniref:Uncharacterized protein n=2 Tax=Pelagibacterium lentulum TaxID=2029865 RepID=A0A916W2G0_9HYPH|nr:hypothetical protein GCM10011499_33820 [Pelagibacterium lentulum]